MERLTKSVLAYAASLDILSLDTLSSQLRTYIKEFLSVNRELGNTLLENCKAVERLFGSQENVLLDRHLSFLASKYAFRVYFNANPEELGSFCLDGVTVCLDQFKRKGSKIVLINHYGRFFEVYVNLSAHIGNVGIAARRKYMARPEYESNIRIYSGMHGAQVFRRFFDMRSYLLREDSCLLFSPDNANFTAPERNRVYRFKGNSAIHLDTATDALIQQTGCQVYLATNLPTYSGLARQETVQVIPISRENPTQDAIDLGLVSDMRRDPSEWDRIKYFDRLALMTLAKASS